MSKDTMRIRIDRSLLLLALIPWLYLWIFAGMAVGQGVGFGQHVPDNEDYAITLTLLGGYNELGFGLVVSGQGMTEIDLNSDEVAIIAVEAVRFLDVFVSLTPPTHIYLDGIVTTDDTKRIPLNIYGGYANSGQGNTGPGYRTPFSGYIVRFPMLRRTTGPPGPPPAPPHSGYKPPRETAYIFLYGDLNAPPGLVSGSYNAHVTVEVTYDL